MHAQRSLFSKILKIGRRMLHLWILLEFSSLPILLYYFRQGYPDDVSGFILDLYHLKLKKDPEEMRFLFSKKTLENCRRVGLEKGSVLALDYTPHGDFEGRNRDFESFDLEKTSNDTLKKYIEESIVLARTYGKELCASLTPTLTRKLLEGRVENAFIPKKWLEKLNDMELKSDDSSAKSGFWSKLKTNNRELG